MNPNSERLYERARQVIPGGIHLSGRALIVGEAPLYLERGRGCRVWDVDGREYIDFVLAYGPMLLGYANERVDEAAIRRIREGSLLSLNHPLHVDFAERLVQRFPSADMASFFKTGSEATTAAVRIARRCTGRRRIARCGYHGWHDWCLPLEDFVPYGLDEQVVEFDANRPETLAAILQAPGDGFAAVILAPEMIRELSRAALEQIFALARSSGAVMILDEVKTAFRMPSGSIQQYFDVRPDLTTLSKALGNGWPVAAVVGRRAIMKYGEGMHLSATYHGDTACMAAAMATLDVLDSEDVTGHVWRLGEKLIDGLNAAAKRHDVPAIAYGEPLPPMPFLRFDPHSPMRDAMVAAFNRETLARGILFHPRHLWFISYAHRDEDIDAALEAADAGFARAKRVSGDA